MGVLKRLFFDEAGSPAMEYALILGLVGVVVFVAMQNLSTSTSTLMTTLKEKVNTMNGTISSNPMQ